MGLGVPTYKLGGNKDAIEHFRAFFRHPNCKLVMVRDPESAKWVREVIQPRCEVEWRPDPVCAMKRPGKVKSEQKTLGVVMRSHRSFTGNLGPVRKLIDQAKAQDYAVKHLVLGTAGIGSADGELAQTLAQEGEEVFVSESLTDLCSEISSCSLLATIKFHGMIVAAMYGIPSIALSVTPKNRNFLKMIGRSEMLGGYNQPDIDRLVSYYPAKIHPFVASKLYRDAKSG
jgi:polysaccharide pyruvyl transferase WcaK-like protein